MNAVLAAPFGILILVLAGACGSSMNSTNSMLNETLDEMARSVTGSSIATMDKDAGLKPDQCHYVAVQSVSKALADGLHAIGMDTWMTTVGNVTLVTAASSYRYWAPMKGRVIVTVHVIVSQQGARVAMESTELGEIQYWWSIALYVTSKNRPDPSTWTMADNLLMERAQSLVQAAFRQSLNRLCSSFEAESRPVSAWAS
jgi:hypothetical protein